MIFLFLLTLFGNADLTKTVTSKGVSANDHRLYRYCVDIEQAETIVHYKIFANSTVTGNNNFLDAKTCILTGALDGKSTIETAVIANCEFYSGATKQ